jgi:plasmid stabilization system protein ParE
MKVVYAPKALRDLQAIADYLMERSPKAAAKVGNDIRAAIDLAALFPQSGRHISTEDSRKLISKRYKYVVYYLIDVQLDEIQITSVFHPAQDRRVQEE